MQLAFHCIPKLDRFHDKLQTFLYFDEFCANQFPARVHNKQLHLNQKGNSNVCTFRVHDLKKKTDMRIFSKISSKKNETRLPGIL